MLYIDCVGFHIMASIFLWQHKPCLDIIFSWNNQTFEMLFSKHLSYTHLNTYKNSSNISNSYSFQATNNNRSSKRVSSFSIDCFPNVFRINPHSVSMKIMASEHERSEPTKRGLNKTQIKSIHKMLFELLFIVQTWKTQWSFLWSFSLKHLDMLKYSIIVSS